MECNISLCNSCNLDEHTYIEQTHHLILLAEFRLEEFAINKIKSVFETQKKLFEKIKNINNNLMQALENDILIKEKIINNYQLNKYNYNSFLNLKNLKFNNNQKYESILENILANRNEIEQNGNKQITSSDYINDYLSIYIIL